MTYQDLIESVFPGITHDEADYILWNLTAFPMAGARTIYRQLRHVKRLRATGLVPCELCGEPACRKDGHALLCVRGSNSTRAWRRERIADDKRLVFDAGDAG